VLERHFPAPAVKACRDAFWPVLLDYLNQNQPNRGPHRHFLPMPFDKPCFAPELFFDVAVLGIVRGAMDDRVVIDQWSCDVPLQGSQWQEFHVDYQRPLFLEAPDLPLPPYMLAVSFGLVRITYDHGPIEIAPGTHRMPRAEALGAVASGHIAPRSVPLEIGDVLVRHPWALHRGTPNLTEEPRALATMRYVRRWYQDDSRETKSIPGTVWRSLSKDQQTLLRFSIEGRSQGLIKTRGRTR
jgi:ectoine hydroxylase-related dioxygenase (phytanoyl-CoA dioxygenase family)